jgi:cell division inhibitor SepF
VVDELGDRVFVVMPQGVELSDSDINKLVADGTIQR